MRLVSVIGIILATPALCQTAAPNRVCGNDGGHLSRKLLEPVY
jgi:hypothetical protein